MKFGYRDRIILIIVLVILILGVGIFVFIKPQWEKLGENQEQLEQLEDEWEKEMQEFDQIPIRQDTINKRYQQAYDLSLNFTDEMNAIELDQFLQEKFMNTEKFIMDDVSLLSSLTVSDEAATSIAFYYYTPSIVTYPLYEYADLDGSLAAAAVLKRLESAILSARKAQTVGTGRSTFTVRINREDTMALIDAVRQYAVDNSDAMLLNSVAISEYSFNGELEEDKKPQAPAEGEEGDTPAAPTKPAEQFIADDNTPGYTQVTFNYTVYYMQEPTKPDVGPTYDSSVWNGDQWRNYTAE